MVNWNGLTLLKVQEDSELGKLNHTMPKLRGYTNLTGEKNEKGFRYLKKPTEIDFKKSSLYKPELYQSSFVQRSVFRFTQCKG